MVGETLIDNDLSASRFATKQRDDWPRLQERIEAGQCQVVWMWECSRGSRDMADWVAFLDRCRAHGVLLHIRTFERTLDPRKRLDRKTLIDEGSNSEAESAAISERVLRGMRNQRATGKPPGRLIFGYLREYDTKGHYVRQFAHPQQGPAVREAVARVLAGESLVSIARRFNAAGIKTADGNQWEAKGIRRIVMNPHYAALRVHQGKIHSVPGEWEAIVSRRDHEACVALMSNPERRTQRGSELRWQSSGAIRCGVCPPRPNGRPQRLLAHPTTRKYMAYMCMACNKNSCKAEWIDGFLEEVMVARLHESDALAVFASAVDENALSEALAEEERLRARLQEFYDEDELSAAGLAAKERQLLPQIEAASERVRRLSAPPMLQDIDLRAMADNWKGQPVRDRREVMMALADIVLMPRTRRTKDFDPSRLGLSRWHGDDRTWADYFGSPAGA